MSPASSVARFPQRDFWPTMHPREEIRTKFRIVRPRSNLQGVAVSDADNWCPEALPTWNPASPLLATSHLLNDAWFWLPPRLASSQVSDKLHFTNVSLSHVDGIA
jgi:hypothetical protein